MSLTALLPSLASRFRIGRRARPIEPQRELYVVIAYHKQTETHHGPFNCEADAASWARAKLKFSAMYGWEIAPLYGPDEGGAVPVQREAAQ